MSKKTSQIIGHQGDVQFRSINSLPKGAVPISNKPIALGKHSGHMHGLTGDVQMFEYEGRVYHTVGSDGAMLQHVHESNFNDKLWKTAKRITKADHEPHLFPEGVYEFYIQNSYNPYSKLMEQVLD